MIPLFSGRFVLTASLRRLKMPMYISVFTFPLVQQILYIMPAIPGILIHYYVFKCGTWGGVVVKALRY